MITGRDILYISSIEWDFLWQAHQEIARRLAADGNRVLYVENSGVRSPGLKDTKRVMARLSRWARHLRQGARQVAPNIFVYAPLVLPPFGSRWQRFLNRHVFLRHLRSVTRRLRMKDILVWTYLPTDTALDIIEAHARDRSLLIYYGLADFSCLTPKTEELAKSEQELLRIADVVFANCSELATKFRASRASVSVFPPGVDMAAFSSDAPGNRPDPLNLSRLPRPIIGYVGGLHRFVDYDLVATIAGARPEWSWVFLGAHQVGIEKLRNLPNIHLPGIRPHEELAMDMRFFDVCIVPYKTTREMSTVVPTKINEYLAAGKAIVSTNLPTVCELNGQHQILTTADSDAKRFLQAIETQLATADDPILQVKRRSVAALADWRNRFAEMCRLIEAKLKTSTKSH